MSWREMTFAGCMIRRSDGNREERQGLATDLGQGGCSRAESCRRKGETGHGEGRATGGLFGEGKKWWDERMDVVIGEAGDHGVEAAVTECDQKREPAAPTTPVDRSPGQCIVTMQLRCTLRRSTEVLCNRVTEFPLIKHC